VTDRALIGKISGVSGVNGEMKLFHYSGESERLAGIGELFFLRCGGTGIVAGKNERGDFTRMKVLSIRYRGRTPILLIEGIGTREAAEGFVGADVYVDMKALAPLGEGSYYVEAITGFAVTGENGEAIGDVAGVMDNPAHDILRVAKGGDGAEMLLPMVDAFILSVDMERREVRVRLPDGLADIYK
jgi:16S rRNA processing protein RimM